jgi:DNA topoisomerase-1
LAHILAITARLYLYQKKLTRLDVTEEQAIELIEAKRKKDAEKLIKGFP